MNKSSDINQNAEELRQCAERKLAVKPEAAPDKPIDPNRLVHELQVHKIELELQNEALREARATAELALERYADLFEFAPIAYFILGTDGLIRQTNFRGGLLLGSERFRLTGQHFTDSVANEYRPVFKRFLEQVFASDGPLRCEIILKAGDIVRWVSIEATADTTCQSCLAAVLDISERKRSEQELQLAAAIYRVLEEAMMVTDDNNRIVAVNPAFTQLTGYTAEEAIARPASLLKSERHDQAFYRELWDRLKNTGHWQGELWNRRKNGDEYLVRLSISTLYSDSGEAIRRVAMGYDITEKNGWRKSLANRQISTLLPNCLIGVCSLTGCSGPSTNPSASIRN
nr:PAS domain S-box protein [Methylomarinum sp. Ch1-1]MDP4519785.1 PAS domain S-box protein [Methylomarinum sp. Ch1-1]